MNSRAQSAIRTPEAPQQQMILPSHGPNGTGIPEKTFQPFGCFIAVHALLDTANPSGLVSPDGNPLARGILETERALVVACGPEVKQVKEGDVVLIQHVIKVLPVIHRGSKVIILREDSVAGIVTKEQFGETEIKK